MRWLRQRRSAMFNEDVINAARAVGQQAQQDFFAIRNTGAVVLSAVAGAGNASSNLNRTWKLFIACQKIESVQSMKITRTADGFCLDVNRLGRGIDYGGTGDANLLRESLS